MNGITVIICCFNSRKRIVDTLTALSHQEFIQDIPWEIILVDNASTDNTGELAYEYWVSLSTGIPFKIVHEKKAGLVYARFRGIEESAYDYLLFCDDDNHLSAQYIQKTYNHLQGSAETAACGGFGIPIFETSKPAWFDQYAEAFALGSQSINSENGRVLNLYGAGLAIKKQVLKEILATGFVPVLTGRQGSKLSSSEDTELTYAMVIRGYRLVCDDSLTFYHFLSKERLQESYLDKLIESSGNDGPYRNLYYAYITNSKIHQGMKNWYFHLLFAYVRMLKYFMIPPKKKARARYLKWSKSYIRSLHQIKSQYLNLKNNIEKIKEHPQSNGPVMNPGKLQPQIN